MTKAKPPATRTLRGWAVSVLQEAGAIEECEEHGWVRGRAGPHARERAYDIARAERPPGISPQAAAVAEVLDSIGDACLEWRPPLAECTPGFLRISAQRS